MITPRAKSGNRRTSGAINSVTFTKQPVSWREKIYTWTVKETTYISWIWDFFIIAISMWNLWSVSFAMAFSKGERNSTFFALDLFVDLCFVADMYISFHVVSRDFVHLRTKENLKKDFYYDAIALIPFEVIPALTGGSTWMSAVCRLPRILRSHRLLQSSRITNLNNIVPRVGILFIYFGLLAHILGCILFYVGEAQILTFTSYRIALRNEFTGGPWLYEENMMDADITTQYITSFYWAVVTMATVGYGDFNAYTNIEKGFIVIWLLFSAVFYAAIFGRISLHIQVRGKSTAILQSDLMMIEEFSSIYNFPPPLRVKCKNYIQYIWGMNRGFDQAKIFEGLPEEVRIEVLLHINGALIRSVATFEDCSQELLRVRRHDVAKKGFDFIFAK